MAKQLIIFTRYPEPGKVKTRLVPLLGPAGAAELHRRLTAHTIAWATDFGNQMGIDVEVHFDGGSTSAMTDTFGNGCCYRLQSTGDLGQRLTSALAERHEPTAVIGTDCPGLGGTHMHQTFDALQNNDVVIGPAKDGGYYLIGVGRPVPQIFESIDWGTERVCQQTRLMAARQGLTVELLEFLDDVDRPEDLKILDRRFFKGLSISCEWGAK